MKKKFVKDLLQIGCGVDVVLSGWVCAKRKQGKIIFWDVCDSTGKIQVVITEDLLSAEKFKLVKRLLVESGVVVRGRRSCSDRGQPEILAADVEIIGKVTKSFYPYPRGNVDIFDETLTPHFLKNRHVYLRNPKVMAILQFRDCLMHHIRQWFYDHQFTAIEAPILTPVPLYDDGSAMSVNVHGENVFLTQCVGYYLEAAVHAFERVYNIGPSFRGEESKSKRHLMEYWHIKAEVAWADLDDIIEIVESIVSYVSRKCQKDTEKMLSTLGTSLCVDGIVTPFPRVSYCEAIKLLNGNGVIIEFGKGLGSEEEAELSKLFQRPFWVTGIPRSIEPFPYVIDPDDTRITRVADLIASNGYGEILGTAEKIFDLQMLDERMREKGKDGDPRYEFIRDIHQVGCVPHSAFGMGVERLIRWLINIPHVRDAVPFPRTFRRRVAP
ncbi:MAG TPA: asparagine--tRNA ligase [Candidatus Paceibacterota bacterium]